MVLHHHHSLLNEREGEWRGRRLGLFYGRLERTSKRCHHLVVDWRYPARHQFVSRSSAQNVSPLSIHSWTEIIQSYGSVQFYARQCPHECVDRPVYFYLVAISFYPIHCNVNWPIQSTWLLNDGTSNELNGKMIPMVWCIRFNWSVEYDISKPVALQCVSSMSLTHKDTTRHGHYTTILWCERYESVTL